MLDLLESLERKERRLDRLLGPIRRRPSIEPPAAWKRVVALFEAGERDESFERFCADLVQITTRVPGEVLPLRWNRAQRRVFERRTGRDVVVKGRQLGETTYELARDLWFALLRPDVAVAVVTQPHKHNEPAHKVIRQLGFMIKGLGVDTGHRWAGPTVQFSNGSSITVFDAGGTQEAAEKQGRGGTYHRVHATEVASFKYGEQTVTAIMAAIPPIEQGGEYVEESTANGASGVFYEHATGARAGANGFRLTFLPWWLDETARVGVDPTQAVARDPEETEVIESAVTDGEPLDAAQLAWWRSKRALNGFDKTIQEHPHDPIRAFLLSGHSYFDAPALGRLEKTAVPPLTFAALEQEAALESPAQPFRENLVELWRTLNRGHGSILRVWASPSPGCSYLLAVDTASGKRAGDWLVAPVLERKSRAHVATLRAKVPASEFARWCERLARAYGLAEIVVERNNHGHTVLHVLHEELHYPRIWRLDPSKTDTADLGFWTGPSNRLPMIDDLVDAVQLGDFKTSDLVFIQEARAFIRTDSGKVEAAPGEHDDEILAAAIGWRVLTGPRPTTTVRVVPNTLNPFG
jgi:hypothetical protein